MRKIIKMRWASFAIWIAAAVLLAVFQPDVNAILRFRGQETLSSDSPSQIAQEILNKMSSAKGKSSIIAFYDANKINDDEMKQIETAVNSIKQDKSKLGLDEFIDPFEMEGAKDQLISKDGTTLMITFRLDKQGREVDDIKKDIEAKLTDVKAEHYITGEDFINNDYLKATESGVEKSAAITVVFILVVLILMFRSVVAPLVSLLAVGVSYLCSMGIAAQLIDKLNFPITSLTQMLLVLILFGIGTDYNILLFNRFKEELAHGSSVDEAIIISYKTAGKTIAYSISTIFIAFLSLSFAEFGIYQSGNVVAIAAVVLLLEIMTFTPAVMKVLGKKLFWPSKNAEGHKDSKLWEKVTSVSVKHPIIVTLAIIIIMVPIAYFSSPKMGFDTLKELGNSYPSSKGFNIVAEHFSRGQALPTTIVVENKDAMDNNTSLAVIDQLTERIKSIKGVKQVSSVTQPQGKQIDNFYISDQTKSVTDGISATKGGVDQIHNGLNQISSNLNAPDFSSVSDLVKGTGDIQTGLGSITAGLEQIDGGIAQGANGAASINGGLTKLKDGANLIKGSLQTMSGSISSIQGGFTQLSAGIKNIPGQPNLPGYGELPGVLSQLNGMIAQMEPSLHSLESRLGADDADVKALRGNLTLLSNSIQQVSQGISALNTQYDSMVEGLSRLKGGLDQLAKSFEPGTQNSPSFMDGITSLEAGAAGLADGLKKGSAGQEEIIKNMKKITDGVGQLKGGQQKLNDGLSQLSGGMGQLKDGIVKSGDGLGAISDGLDKTNGFLTQLNSNKTFFMPKEALENADFKKAMDSFMTGDRKISKLLIILNDDPYSMSAIDTVQKINDTVTSVLRGTSLSEAKFGTAGPSSTTNDMNKVLTGDLSRTKTIVLIGIFLVLMLVIRSFWTSAFITGSLMAAYYTAMTVTNFVVYKILKFDGVSSFVPFFAFIIIVSLGVDYSIFLMMRYKEYPHLPAREAIIKASKNIGGVVMSAALILGGTFATLMPSGLYLLIELATAVIVGLSALCFILLPTFLPALISLLELVKQKFSSSDELQYDETESA